MACERAYQPSRQFGLFFLLFLLLLLVLFPGPDGRGHRLPQGEAVQIRRGRMVLLVLVLGSQAVARAHADAVHVRGRGGREGDRFGTLQVMLLLVWLLWLV